MGVYSGRGNVCGVLRERPVRRSLDRFSGRTSTIVWQLMSPQAADTGFIPSVTVWWMFQTIDQRENSELS